MQQYVFILGTHPEISFAELQALLGDSNQLTRQHGLAFLQTPQPLNASELMQQLGGTIKIVELIDTFDEDKIVDWLFDHIDEKSKFHFGFSEYATEPGIPTKKDWKYIQRMGLGLKKALKNQGISARYVGSKEVILSSVIVHKERLLKNGVEIVLFKSKNGMQFGKTLAVQPFQDFSKRDYGRPGRNSKSGMLPPKLARMMVNLAQPKKESVILDPFCGSGTVLQEALLLGYRNVIGSDKSPKAVKDSLKNMQWMNLPKITIAPCAAEQLLQKHIVDPHSVDRIIFEGYLGPPTPRASDLARVQKELQRLYAEVFPVLQQLLRAEGRIVAALPFWHTSEQEMHLDVRVLAQKSGLKFIAKPLLYRRPQSTVGREILQLKN